MTLMTTRSHDQYNTTIYGLDDRYRGVYRPAARAVRQSATTSTMLGFEAGQRVDITSVWDDGIERRADGFLLVEYDIPRGCLGAYYPETNPLVPLVVGRRWRGHADVEVDSGVVGEVGGLARSRLEADAGGRSPNRSCQRPLNLTAGFNCVLSEQNKSSA